MYNQSDATQVFNETDQWSVNLADDDTRTMSGTEIALEAARGQLDQNDTYVWREGMSDWLPIAHCPDLQELIAQQRGIRHQAGIPQDLGGAEGFGATRMVDGDDDDLTGTMTMEGQAAHGASHAMASPLDYGEPPAEDIFAAARPAAGSAPSSPPSDQLLGARNEASALFSIDDLKRAAESPSKSSASSSSADDPFGDIVPGGGGLDFDAPPLNAPAPPPPPPPPKPTPQPAAQAHASVAPMSGPVAGSGMPMVAQAQPKKSKMGLIIGAVLGALLVVGGVAALTLGGSDDPEPSARAAKSEEPSGEAEETSDEAAEADEEAEDTAKDEGEEEEAKSDDADEDEDEDEKADEDEAEADEDGKVAASTSVKSTTSSKKDDDKKEVKKEEKKEEEKKPEPKGEFNQNAARSALSGAAGAASGCKQPGGPTGRGRVTVTFAPSGRATQATVGPPFAGTAVGSCAASAFRGASVPPFSGSSVTVSKSFFIK